MGRWVCHYYQYVLFHGFFRQSIGLATEKPCTQLLSKQLTFLKVWANRYISAMPDFVYEGKRYYNPVEFALDRIGGTWKMPILWRLKDNVMRYGELKTSLKHISDKMLSSQLKELEKDGMVSRKVYPVVPPKTEYTITPKGMEATQIIDTLRQYGLSLMEELGIKEG
jgi:DNA-binding HxlR family transcriptional regulator